MRTFSRSGRPARPNSSGTVYSSRSTVRQRRFSLIRFRWVHAAAKRYEG